MNELLKRELIILAQYLTISFVSAIWAYDSHMTYHYGESNGSENINVLGMLSVMWIHTCSRG